MNKNIVGIVVLVVVVLFLSACAGNEWVENATGGRVGTVQATPSVTPTPTPTPEVTEVPATEAETEAATEVPATEAETEALKDAVCGPTEEWMDNIVDMLSGEESPFSLITALDNQFNKNWYVCGEPWGPEGVTLKKGTLLWTDFGDEWQLPAELKRVKTRGNWGVYLVVGESYTIESAATGGGRWVPLVPNVK